VGAGKASEVRRSGPGSGCIAGTAEQLYGLPLLDPVSDTTGVAGLGAALIVGMLLPAWRPLRINPASAHRCE
jgi:hypothetical protein